VPLRVHANHNPVEIATSYVDAASTLPMPWPRVRLDLAEEAATLPDFDAVFAALEQQTGPTWGDYVAMLGRNAALLPVTFDAYLRAGIFDPQNPVELARVELRKTAAALGTSLAGQLDGTGYSLNLSGRRITALNQDTQEAFATEAWQDNSFLFASLTPGAYAFQVEGALVTSPAPGAVTVADGQAVTGVTLGPGGYLDLGEIALPSGGGNGPTLAAAANAHDLEAQLSTSEAFLLSAWVPQAHAALGPATAHLWQLYLDGNSFSPPARLTLTAMRSSRASRSSTVFAIRFRWPPTSRALERCGPRRALTSSGCFPPTN